MLGKRARIWGRVVSKSVVRKEERESSGEEVSMGYWSMGSEGWDVGRCMGGCMGGGIGGCEGIGEVWLKLWRYMERLPQ